MKNTSPIDPSLDSATKKLKSKLKGLAVILTVLVVGSVIAVGLPSLKDLDAENKANHFLDSCQDGLASATLVDSDKTIKRGYRSFEGTFTRWGTLDSGKTAWYCLATVERHGKRDTPDLSSFWYAQETCDELNVNALAADLPINRKGLLYEDREVAAGEDAAEKLLLVCGLW